ncbi:nicotinate-nucleotide adenylyltransferase [Dictyobacter arantiisoli]|uniref:Probable nicotinate-nucleotide adenylyltransferase n=1 Tax=Dictyobacter arantiisoli TaxID=2014874 RepID=A0A5A5T9E2_9CHLR|nr:nicotinate-nucleotide adenylyltransferase [Dictyobacter arantiisoli]GCF07653.1 putative nicotinate-nucleotide adenylyltransferase [Dictyobacter arantiisoli]
MRSIGLMGGTFDPIHHAHLIVAEEVRSVLGLTEMVFIPAGEPPHKAGRHTAPARHRLAMVELALLSNPHFTISRIELDRPGPSYLVDTLRLLHEQWGPEIELSFVIGWDSLEDFPGWYQPEGILRQLTRLIAVRRPGYVDDAEYNQRMEARLPGLLQKLCIVPVPQLDISSTDLRQRVAEKRPITYQVPEAVEHYIQTNQLYQHPTAEIERYR